MSASLDPDLTELSLGAAAAAAQRQVGALPEPTCCRPGWRRWTSRWPSRCEVALAEAVELDDTGYAWPPGLGLAEAFAEFAAARLGWGVDPGRVSADPRRRRRRSPRCCARSPSPATGSIINTPVYHPFFSVIEELGCELVEAPLRRGRARPRGGRAALRRGARALILCSPHNPTGSVPSREQLRAVAAAAAATAPGCWPTRSTRR